ncbi:Pfam:DUF803 [Geosmithia morbida]|uniref:Pfam:DUF803 n=1 Tax=Geosmithia morbida TaxID=1094350 RepID=A0A9P5D7M1_9HYPO|nr:Pfam:DUF803 [Geosmithia morbida]KAF4124639.1 Pfam:DUF803 [Geosmithia morbida]
MGLPGGLSPAGGIALGIIVGIISTSVQSVGLTLQRKSHILEDEKWPHEMRRPPYRRRRWQIAMGMFLMANIVGSSVQISTLPLPVLSTLQAAGLVFNSICASVILHEPFTRWSFYGTALVTTGAVLIATFGAIPEAAHDLDELLVLLARRPFVVWMILQGVFVVAVAVAMEVVCAVTNLAHNSGRFRLVRGIVYGMISGMLSAHALLFAKSSVELIISTISGSKRNQFAHWQSWMIVMALVALALSQLYYLHRGLKLVSTSVLYPLVFCVYNIIAILDGLIYFDQTSLISPLRACIIALGTCILLSGVLALSWRLSEEQHTPGVGQSSLAPGLGLVEDTEGEDDDDGDDDGRGESSSLLGSESAIEDSDASGSGYQTFPPVAPNGTEATLLTPTKKKGYRRAERAEIWDELQDQDTPTSPVGHLRPSTLPGRRTLSGSASGPESTPLILPPTSRKAVGSQRPGHDSAVPSSRHRRRRSTGFPGLVARRNSRRRGRGGDSSPSLRQHAPNQMVEGLETLILQQSRFRRRF